MDWLHDLSTAWLALVVFAAAYVVAATIYLAVIALAVRAVQFGLYRVANASGQVGGLGTQDCAGGLRSRERSSSDGRVTLSAVWSWGRRW
jgi:hypothetical protein